MNVEEKNSLPNPLNGINLLSRIFFWSAIPLFRKGWNDNLKLHDVFDCPNDDTSARIGGTVQKEWDKELEKLKHGKQPSLTFALIRAFGLKYCLFGSFALFYYSLCEVGRAILLGNIIRQISQVPSSAQELYLNAVGMGLLGLLGTFLYQQYYFEMARSGMTMKTACCLLIYKKALKISQFSLSTTSVGQMVNLLSNDVGKFDEASFYLPFLIIGPIHFSIVLYIVWLEVGYTGLMAMSLLLMYLPIQILMGKVSAALRLKTAYLTDERINLMSSIIDQIRGIKMYGWELPFAKLVDQSRRNEIKKVWQVHIIRGVNLIMYCLSYKVMLLISVAVFVLSVGGDLTPDRVFTCIMLFYSVRTPMIYCFTQSISNGAEALTSFKRIQKFLLLEEHSQTLNLNDSNENSNTSECGILINKVDASWRNAATTTLRNITIDVKSGDLLAIVGPVGCGKTSLLMTILGELPIISGETKIKGRVAFASQEPWIFDGTIRQNITFGSDFDNSRYKAVINACALNKDIRSFPHGDMTAVGERGVRLSGGQKARLNLARAIYLDADIFLLDDPLSAVDSSVSKHLFDKCIDGFLKNKIRILVTHQLQYLRRASKVLVMENGMCSAFGTYQQLIQAGIQFSSFVEDPKEQKVQKSLPKYASSKICIGEEDLNYVNKDSHSESISSTNVSANECSEEEMFYDTDAIPRYMRESKFSGSVTRNVYKEYIISGGSILFVMFVLFSQLITQVFMNGSDFWLTNWSSLEQLKYTIRVCWRNLTTTFLNATGYDDGTMNQSMIRVIFPDFNDDCKRITENYTMGVDDMAEIINEQYQTLIYGSLLLALIILYITRVTSFYKLCMKSSVILHDRLFRNILRSPTSFFDTVPVGNILNRVSQDLGVIDEALPLSSMLVSEVLVDFLGIVTVTFIAEPYLILVAAVLAVCCFTLSRIYLPTARDLKRYESITRSPIFTLLSSSLNGLTTIRNLKIQDPLEKLFKSHQDKHTSTFIAFLVCAHCFSTFLDIICNLYATCVIVAMILLSGDPSFAARAGLAISVSLQLCIRFQWGMNRIADVESQMTSVERVLDYSNLKSEADLESRPEKRPPKIWPLRGHIVYKNVNLRYFPHHDPVLKDLNFEIYPTEKIGIVGRTGAGKSSLLTSLLRLTEPEGLIEIDNVCTKDIGLHDLRKRITIIPQDPTLFIGTVRKNLDPFDEYTDSDIWQALEEVYLKETVHLLPGGLDANVFERGNNFSVGQRQLICLARAILRRNRILVLDEATANVDLNTDRLIQLAIRKRFADCTILIIAHRLHTIMDADRVLVMESGEIKEFDTPYNLIEKTDGIFSHMLKMTGDTIEKQLKDIAAGIYLKRISRNQTVSDSNTKDQIVGNFSEILPPVSKENVLNGYSNASYDDMEMSHL